MTLLAFEDQVKPPAPFEAEVGSPSVSAKERNLAEALLTFDRVRMMLRDEGSRLGTWTGRQRERLVPRQFVDLSALHYEFQIGELRLRAQAVDPSPGVPR